MQTVVFVIYKKKKVKIIGIIAQKRFHTSKAHKESHLGPCALHILMRVMMRKEEGIYQRLSKKDPHEVLIVIFFVL